MSKHRIFSLVLIALLVLMGYFIYASESGSGFLAKFPFRLGLDLNGGTQLVYKADVSKIDSGNINDSMEALRDVIEKRVNIFGVSEPIIQVEQVGILSGGGEQHRLIVELPGVTQIEEATALIGQTPSLEFRLVSEGASGLTEEELKNKKVDEVFISTGLTGRFVERAALEFNSTTGEPAVALSFNKEGKDLFAKITRENTGKVLAIFLDGAPISMPVISEEIKDGRAQISGNFTPEEARTLVRNLNYGALPVPIELVGTESVGASLGKGVQMAGVKAGILSIILVALFLILWYRLPGVIAAVALLVYVFLSLVIFKLVPVTLTAAGIAGFILSVGMAVDANVLIFERMKEELRKGKSIADATREGFVRAWNSIRDSNISSIITAIILFWLGTSAVKGFALTFGIGVLVSMFSAITVSRTFLFAIQPKEDSKLKRFLFSNGFYR